MTDPNKASCFRCGREIDKVPGNHYCDRCVAEDLHEQGGDERTAFVAYHAWVDAQGQAARSRAT